MGASLPAIARWIETTPRGVEWLGWLYGGNTAGAVFGCLLAGFYLLRVFNMATATFAAAAVNVAGALISFALARRTPPSIEEISDSEPRRRAEAQSSWTVYVTIALSGACALGAEVIWTRLMALLLGATVYTFSIILAVFLLGLGIGAAAGSALSREVQPRIAIGCCQLLIALGVAWPAFLLTKMLPSWPMHPNPSAGPWYLFAVDLMRVIRAILPATFLWGASFPLALAGAASEDEDAGRLVSGIYAANTGGAIAGALVFSMILIPRVGTHQSERILIALSMIGSLFMLAPAAWSARSKIGALALTAAMVGATFLAWRVAPVPPLLIAYGRLMTSYNSEVLYVGEGMNSSIAVSRFSDDALMFHVSGKVEASTEPADMKLQRMLGLMPALIHPDSRSVLVVGFGAGVTAGSFVKQPDVRRIVICEIEPLIPPTATLYFKDQNYNVLHDPRTQVDYDDARHYILTTSEQFDIITSDPIHPWVKGSATLYSREYFDQVKRHLNPGGIVTQWAPLYETDPQTVKSEIATFFDVFPNGSIWANELANQGGYDIVLFGQNEPAQINIDDMQRRLNLPQYAGVRESLAEVGFNSASDLLSTYAGQSADLKPWLQGAEINLDRNLRLQYLAGMAVDNNRQNLIYDEILSYRQFPVNLFAGSGGSVQMLRDRIAEMNRLYRERHSGEGD